MRFCEPLLNLATVYIGSILTAYTDEHVCVRCMYGAKLSLKSLPLTIHTNLTTIETFNQQQQLDSIKNALIKSSIRSL